MMKVNYFRGLLLFVLLVFLSSPSDAQTNQDGSLDTSFRATIDRDDYPYVAAIEVLPDGSILVGGSFTEINGIPKDGIARLFPTGELDTDFDANIQLTQTNQWVKDILYESDGKIFIAGHFHANGRLGGMVRRNSDGSFIPSDWVSPYALDGVVEEVTKLSNGKYVIVGDFTSYFGHTSINRIARFRENGQLDSSFKIGTGANGQVVSVAPQNDGKLIIGGEFTEFNGSQRNHIVRLNSDGTVDNTFDIGSGANGLVETLALQVDGKVIVGGDFTEFNGVTANRLVRLNSDGSVDNSFAETPWANATVRAVKIQTDGKILVGGSFNSIESGIYRFFVRLNSDGTRDRRMDGYIDNRVLEIVQHTDNDLLIGGWFGETVLKSHAGIQRRFNSVSIQESIRNPVKDFDGDGKADISVYRPSTGVWYILNSASQSSTIIKFGIDEDIPVAADYDGDGKADIAVWRPSTGVWYIYESGTNQVKIYSWGLTDDVPVQGDYDGDGLSDLAVFRPSNGFWYILNTVDFSTQYIKWGIDSDLLMPGDFYNDGFTIPAVFRFSGSDGFSYLYPNAIADPWFPIFSLANVIPLAGDFFGDGTADRIIFDRSNGHWGIKPPEYVNGTFLVFEFGGQDDYPVVNDYDGDGRVDIAIYNRSNNIWTVRLSTGGLIEFEFGLPGDIPVQLPVGFRSY